MSESVRFTVTLPAELHRQIKVTCASEGEYLGDRVRAVLEKEFSRSAR